MDKYDGLPPGYFMFDCPCCLMPDIERPLGESRSTLKRTAKVRTFIYSKDPRAIKARSLIREILNNRARRPRAQ